MQSVAYGDFRYEHLSNEKTLLSANYSLGLFPDREMKKKAFLRESKMGGSYSFRMKFFVYIKHTAEKTMKAFFKFLSDSYSAQDVCSAVFPSKGTIQWKNFYTFWKKANSSLPIRDYLPILSTDVL